MGFKNKYGEPLIPFTSPKEVFDEWRKMSFGRPLDCSALTYEKLTGGSGIQWPCTKEHPYGKDRLFDDGKFFTDTDYCESYGHDLETGTPYTRAQYQAMNPAGRAILKSAQYKPSLEIPNEDYPLLLSTGRNVFHFHTRTKTGRARRLQQADQEPIVQISVEDAQALHVTEGEMVVVRSRRGSVELPVRIGGINDGHVFIPFHFGYWDATDGRARAANELTIGRYNVEKTDWLEYRILTNAEQWDPVSKQPMFKSGAVRIEKCVQKEAERQTMAVRSVEMRKPDAASSAGDNSNDKKPIRRMELWLGATDQALEMLRDMYVDMIPRLVHDMEIQSGLQVMRRITCEISDQFKPIIERYHESQQYGRRVAEHLRDSIFPAIGESKDPYEALAALQSLDLFLTYIEGHLTALSPESQALWDCDFIEAVKFAQKGIQRQKGWVSQHIKVKSPQTLLVPSAAAEELSGEDSRMAGQIRC